MIKPKENIGHQLTKSQQGIWYTEKLYVRTSQYNIGGVAKIKGKIDIEILKQSLSSFIRENEVFRLKFDDRAGEPFQYLDIESEIKIGFLDFSGELNPEEVFNRWADEEMKYPFDLSEGHLYKVTIIGISPDVYCYFVKTHHIISDGWSMMLLSSQVVERYETIRQKGNWIASNYSYLDLIKSEFEYFESKRFLKDEEYWKKKFQGYKWQTETSDFNEILGERKEYRFDGELTKKIKYITNQYKISLNTFFIAVYVLYNYMYKGKEDMVLSIPIYNRYGKIEKNVFGMFANTLPLRIKIDEKQTVEELLLYIKTEISTALYHQKYPYYLIKKNIDSETKGYQQIFDTSINYYNTKHKLSMGGYDVEYSELYSGYQSYPLQIIIKEWDESKELDINFDYQLKYYSEDKINNLFKRFEFICNEIIDTRKEIPLKYFQDTYNPYVLKGIQKQIEYTKIFDLIELQATKNLNRIAIQHNEEILSYSELLSRVECFAKYLFEMGIKKGMTVGLYTKHSIETIVSILALLKLGAAFLPLDYKQPIGRLESIIHNSKLKFILTNVTEDKSRELDTTIINISNIEAHNQEHINYPEIAHNDLAYIIYTSGSTGKPKGVMIEHASLINYIGWAKNAYSVQEQDVFPLYSSLAFDLTLTSIFLPLISGAQIVIYDEDENKHVIYRIIEDGKSTIIKLTPAHLQLLMTESLTNKSIKKMIVGGDDLKVDLAKCISEKYDNNIEIYNEYGPTEATVGCIVHRYDKLNDVQGSVPIGFPIENTAIFILNDRNELADEGELYILGKGLARGYDNDMLMTESRFFHNTFVNQRAYKTGDLVRLQNNGILIYLGRCDRQIKLNGYRIELEEIERNILSLNSVKDAYVTLKEINDNKILCAYIVYHQDIIEDDIQRELRNLLPHYMIPACIVKLEALPLTRNGKVNSKALPMPEIKKKTLQQDYFTKKESILVGALERILKLMNISIEDDFFNLGGDSIKAIQLSSALGNMGYSLKVQDIMMHARIHDMAERIVDIDKNEDVQVSGELENTPIWKWFFNQNFSNINHYNQSILIKINQKYQLENIKSYLNKIIQFHDGLRINYSFEKQRFFYNEIHKNNGIKISLYDISQLDEENQKKAIHDVGLKLKASFNIEDSLLFSGAYFKRNANENLLLLTAHHVVVDIVSWQIIVSDLFHLMNGGQLILKTDSLKKWALSIQEHAKNISLESIEYWKEYTNTSFHSAKKGNLVENPKTITVKSKHLMTDLNSMTKHYHVSKEELLLTAFSMTLKKYSDSQEVFFEMENNGRRLLEVDLSHTVGWFTCIYPVKLFFSSAQTELIEVVTNVKEQLRKKLFNIIDYGILRYYLEEIKDTRIKPIRYNFLGDLDALSDHLDISCLQLDTGDEMDPNNHLSSLFDFNISIFNNYINLDIKFSTMDISENEVGKFIDEFYKILELMKEEININGSVSFSPSDFEGSVLTQQELDFLFE